MFVPVNKTQKNKNNILGTSLNGPFKRSIPLLNRTRRTKLTQVKPNQVFYSNSISLNDTEERPLGTSLNSVQPDKKNRNKLDPINEINNTNNANNNYFRTSNNEKSETSEINEEESDDSKSLSNENTGNEVDLDEVDEDEVALDNYYKERLIELTQRSEKCKEDCEQVKKEKRELEDILHKKKIDSILLSTDKKLIDLLIERILDKSPTWREKIDTLINIPNSITGNLLRGGDYFEALFQLAIAIGILPIFKNTYIRFYDIKGYKTLFCIENYLHDKTIKNSGGAEQGISDITFEISNTIDERYILPCKERVPTHLPNQNPFYFISVKGYKKEKSIKNEYDVPLLFQQIKELDENTKELLKENEKHIIVSVRNKDKFLENLSRTKMDFLKKSISHVIGYEEMMDAFQEFRSGFLYTIQDMDVSEEVHRLFPKNQIHKQMLGLYFHQELIVKSVIHRIKEEPKSKPHFLCIGVLPRGGKSFIAGGIIDSHKKIVKKESGYNVLFLTSAVNETKSQFKEELIEKYAEFSNFEFVDVVKEGKPKDKVKVVKKNMFYFMSRQLSGREEEGKETEEIEQISKGMLDTLKKKLGYNPDFDIIFFDEAHIGILADTVRKNFQKAFEAFKTPIVLMTATYKKPSNLLDSNKDLFIWDLQDIKDMQSLPTLKLEGMIEKNPDLFERYPEIALSILNDRIEHGETLETISRPYIQFPTPNFISLKFTPETISQLETSKDCYQFTKPFQDLNVDPKKLMDHTKYKEWGDMITHKEHAILLRQFMTPVQPSEQDLTYKDEKTNPCLVGNHRRYRALNQIFTIAQKNGSRPIQGKPFSMLMFLPFNFKDKDKDTKKHKDTTKIGDLCRVWASFMMQSTYWRENFVFLTLSTLTYSNYKKDPHITIPLAVEKGICHREDHPEDLKELIVKVEKEAYRKGKGLVLLSGDVAKMGISLKFVDVVFLMTNKTDADDIIQKMYRALTDDPPTKKDGFIVDLDLKRTIRAMYDYDLVKDKMRISKNALPTIQERVQKIWDLCNWGQDSFIEEQSDMDFNDVMNEIKKRVLNDLTSDIETYNQTIYKDLEVHQKEQFREESLYKQIKDILKQTNFKKRNTGNPKSSEIVMERGQNIPGPGNIMKPESEGEFKQESQEQNEEKHEAPLLTLTDNEIENKMFSILKTFINAIVYKSSESWDTNMNLFSLIEKYKKDKLLLKGEIECNCNHTNKCENKHDNLYETAFCEISSYAMKIVSTNPVKYEYNKEIHKNIMILIEEVMKNSSLFVDWNIYIENLLKEIHDSKSLIPRK